jgi:hypothetical protein
MLHTNREDRIVKFTQTNVRKLAAPEGTKDLTIYDEAMPGFGIRFRNGGIGNYVIVFRCKKTGKQERLPLGSVAKIELEAAQIEAKQHFADVAKGENPAQKRRDAAGKAAATVTIGQLAPTHFQCNPFPISLPTPPPLA